MRHFYSAAALIVLSVLCFTACSKKESGNDYFPLQVGNCWEYEAKQSENPAPIKLEIKIPKTEKVGTHECYVIETMVNDSSEPLQREFYTRTGEGIAAVKRVYGDREMSIEPPEIMVKNPFAQGQKWGWQGAVLGGKAELTFNVGKSEKCHVMDRDIECLRMEITQKLQPGEESHVTRWFAQGIGIVREETKLKKGKKELSMSSILKKYVFPSSSGR